MSIYPEKIQKVIETIEVGEDFEFDAIGRGADFLCGVSLEFRIAVRDEDLVIKTAGFRSNGCGYVVAAAEKVTSFVKGRSIKSISDIDILENAVCAALGEFPSGRQHCLNLVVDSFRQALADFRLNRISLWNGDTPLVCSCFGVSESDIENAMKKQGITSIEDVGDLTSAGTGCGSCQHVIGEILEGLDL